MTQAQRNANDGISIAQTTEGALNEINNNVQRIRELTVQAANNTNSGSDLQSIQDEINQRLAEINRVSEQTQFNGVKVLASDNAMSIQVGANDNERITINLQKIDAKELDLENFQVRNKSQLAEVTTANIGSSVKVNIQADANTTAATAEGLYALKDNSGYVVKDTTGKYWEATLDASTGEVTWDTTDPDDAIDVTTVNVSGGALQQANAVVTLNAVGAGESWQAILDDNGVATGDYAIKRADSSYVDAKVASDGTFERSTEVSTRVVTTDANANPLQTLDKALSKIDSLRGELGAVQNRFESTITSLTNTVTNLSAARSRIEDADYAVEVSNMTRAQILQQAGTSVLAQANQVPQGVLSLLR